MALPLKPDDPAYWMLLDDYTTTPTVHDPNCYICRDPEFAQMGLPLCYACHLCGGHVAADNPTCDECGHELNPSCSGCNPQVIEGEVVDGTA